MIKQKYQFNLHVTKALRSASNRSSTVAKQVIQNQLKLIVKDNQMSQKRYMIAKHADQGYWSHYYDSNPQDGLHISHSACHTPTGKNNELPETFSSREEAQPYLDKMIQDNPSVGYAIIPVLTI